MSLWYRQKVECPAFFYGKECSDSFSNPPSTSACLGGCCAYMLIWSSFCLLPLWNCPHPPDDGFKCLVNPWQTWLVNVSTYSLYNVNLKGIPFSIVPNFNFQKTMFNLRQKLCKQESLLLSYIYENLRRKISKYSQIFFI